ncbi:ribonuclease III [Catenovulum agarivorans DS-2]|uniref:Ribonuclease 3 n=1 Tax=Catenovulum agarivorans DS-2 TaxID=1328313 RepID=W7QRF2_9ALTE|nr:ribonuclease III [Catenovulum agarivorans]EWH10458.1 ribonuclease III [Catenovulum agarivorans DS-2]
MNNLHTLSKTLGYQFNNIDLLAQALTHRSAKGDHNERLEFLGDSVLSFVIAERLYQQFPKCKEGDLSRMRSTLVRGETLVELAKDFAISDYLVLGPGELKSGGHRRTSILEDAIEAIIGAIYLDSDMPTIKSLILAWYESRLAALKPGQAQKDAKTQLQEWLQGRKLDLPEYQIESISGKDHKQTFTVNCVVGDSHQTQGKGSSRRKAEQEAARAMLIQLT